MVLVAVLRASLFLGAANLASAEETGTMETGKMDLDIDVHKKECKDYSAHDQGISGYGPGEKDDTCWKHMEWAINKGLKTHGPNAAHDWYPEGTQATPTDVQCALYLMSLGENGNTADGHACVHPPCKTISDKMLHGKADDEGNPNLCLKQMKPTKTVKETPAPGPDMWVIALIAAAVAALLGVVLFFFCNKPGAPKKKRAVQLKAPEPAPTTVTPVPTYVVAPPAYIETAPPVVTSVVQEVVQAAPAVTYAAPVYTTAPEVITAPPVYTSTVQEVVEAAPAATYAAPVTTTAAPVYAAPQVAPLYGLPQVAPVYAAPQVAPVYAAPQSVIMQGSVLGSVNVAPQVVTTIS